jgi:hypothetical protein
MKAGDEGSEIINAAEAVDLVKDRLKAERSDDRGD